MSDVAGQLQSELTGQELPDLPTQGERVAWLLGRLTDQTPFAVRTMIRSMLLPRLEAMDEASLNETLVLLKDRVLPWLVGGSDGGLEPADGQAEGTPADGDLFGLSEA